MAEYHALWLSWTWLVSKTKRWKPNVDEMNVSQRLTVASLLRGFSVNSTGTDWPGPLRPQNRDYSCTMLAIRRGLVARLRCFHRCGLQRRILLLAALWGEEPALSQVMSYPVNALGPHERRSRKQEEHLLQEINPLIQAPRAPSLVSAGPAQGTCRSPGPGGEGNPRRSLSVPGSQCLEPGLGSPVGPRRPLPPGPSTTTRPQGRRAGRP